MEGKEAANRFKDPDEECNRQIKTGAKKVECLLQRAPGKEY